VVIGCLSLGLREMARINDRTVLLVILIVLAITSFVFDQRDRLSPAERGAGEIAVPVERVLVEGIGKIIGALETVQHLRTLQSENAALRAEVEKLTVDNVRLSSLASENAALREQLQFKADHPDLGISSADVIARVVAQDPSNLLSTLTIDRGSQDGIRRGMPVVSPRGLIGQITDVGAHWSRVLLLIDPSSSIQALTLYSRAVGVVQGTPAANPRMLYIAPSDEIEVGDIVLTSGMGGNFPKGLVIGQVVRVQHRPVDMFKEAEIHPTVDFNRLEFVMVITKFEPVNLEEP